MKKITILFVVLCILPIITIQASNNPDLRIYLKSFGQNSSYQIENKEINAGYRAGDILNGELSFRSEEGFQIEIYNLYYIKLNAPHLRYESAYAALKDIRNRTHKACVVYEEEGKFYPALAGFHSLEEARQYINTHHLNAQICGMKQKELLLSMQRDEYLLIEKNSAFAMQSIQENNIMTINKRKYRNILEFSRKDNALYVYNVISCEDYLCGVIPSEMPSYWNLEALKAQAVAARTYALIKSSTPNKAGYHMDDTISYQVYKGVNHETQKTNEAVRETAGKAIYYENRLIEAVYFANSGGVTEDSERVWTNALPYLRSVEDKAETNAKEWVRSFTLTDLQLILKTKQIDLGNVLEFRIISYTPSGRVQEIQVVGSKGSRSFYKEECRTFFSPAPGGSLDSRMYRMQSGSIKVNDHYIACLDGKNQGLENIKELYIMDQTKIAEKVQNQDLHARSKSELHVLKQNVLEFSNSVQSAKGNFTLIGRGFGHGVGMSQEGARSLAELGYEYQEILKHYYTGVEIK